MALSSFQPRTWIIESYWMVVHPAEISKAFLEAVDVRGRIKLDSASGVYTNLHVVGKTRRLVVERVL